MGRLVELDIIIGQKIGQMYKMMYLTINGLIANESMGPN